MDFVFIFGMNETRAMGLNLVKNENMKENDSVCVVYFFAQFCKEDFVKKLRKLYAKAANGRAAHHIYL